VTLVFAILFCATAAFGEPSDADKARARGLMDAGDALVAQHSLDKALATYRAADAIMGVTSTGIEVARTLVALGRLLEARKVATRVAAIPADPNEPDPFSRARNAAAALTRELDRRIPQLSLEVRGVREDTSVEVRIDGKAVPSDALAGPHSLDPGAHDVAAAAGGATTSAHVVLRERDRQTVTLTFAAEKPSPEPVPLRKSSSPTLGYAIGGVGLAGLAVAGVTSVIVFQHDKEAKRRCPDGHCPTDADIDYAHGQTPLLVGNAVAWGVGVVGAALGAYLILTHDDKERPETAVAPTLSATGASLSLRRAF
jgi:hypothetical protein